MSRDDKSASTDGHVLDRLDSYLHGVLVGKDVAMVESHVEDCPICRVAIDEARRRFEIVSESAPPVEASAELLAKAEKYAIDRGTRRERNWRIVSRTIVGFATAAAIAIGVFHAKTALRRPSPYDLRILGQRHFLPDSDAAVRIGLFDARTNEPLKEVAGRIDLVGSGEKVTLASFTTSEDGLASPRFKLPDWPDGRYRLVVHASPGGGEETLQETITLRRSWKLMFSTDKPVYKPGDTIHLRGLALRRPDLRPLAGRDAQFTISDPKGNLIFRRSDVTTRFGIVSADCPLASEIIEGDYTLRLTMDGTTSERTVKIERYVLPKFRVQVQLDEPYYQPGQRVTGSIDAGYFFGQPVSAARLQLVATAPDITETTFHESTLTTNEEGRATFAFTLPSQFVGREQERGGALFRVRVNATDTAGQVAFGSAVRRVVAQPIDVMIVPESAMLVPDVPNRFFLVTSYPNGSPAQTTLVVSGSDQLHTTGDDGVAVVEATPSGGGIHLVVKATDDEGRSGRSELKVTAGTATGAFLIRTDKPAYRGGETVSLTALGGGVEPIFIDLLRDGQTVLSATVSMQNGDGHYDIDLPAELFGTLQLVAYRFGSAGLPVRQSKTLIVQQADDLHVTAELDRDEYRPGSDATIRFKLQDSEGRPAPGALSLAAVDEAVFAVLGPQLGMERTFFQLEQTLLQPAAVVYPATNLDSAVPADNGLPMQDSLPLPRDMRFDAEPMEVTQARLASTSFARQGADAVPARFVTGSVRDGYQYRNDPLSAGLNNSEQDFSLAAVSFPAKRRAVNAARWRGLRQAQSAWIWYAVSLALVGLTVFAAYRPRAFVISVISTVAIGLPLACVGLASVIAVVIMAGPPGCASEAGFLLGRATNMAASEGAPMAEMPESAVFEGEERDPGTGESHVTPPRTREWFPETLVWRPEVVTDEQGIATLSISPLADSITTWRLSASAVDSEGRLGALQTGIRVFQPFFVDVDLPAAFTRGDEVSMPVVVYNYLDQAQTVDLSLEDAPWFQRLDDGAEMDGSDASAEPMKPMTLTLGPREVRSVHVRLRMLDVGRHSLTVTARSGEAADAIRREVLVEPDGVRHEQLASGVLERPFETQIELPADIVPGSAKVHLTLHPSSLSQMVDGLEGIFAMPHGCFEQTSSTLFPNVMALQYLQQTGKSSPEVEARARQYIHLGYQRLLTFEVNGGGFDWFGRPPAHPQLTAYGLMEFEEMAKVHDVDPALIARTRLWLLDQRSADGSWKPRNGLDSIGTDDELKNTAYIAWAVSRASGNDGTLDPTVSYLTQRDPQSIDNPYLVALIANTLVAIDRETELNATQLSPASKAWLSRLMALSQRDDGHKTTWWELPEGVSTAFRSTGKCGHVETTALATLALLESGEHPQEARNALRWLVAQKSEGSTWGSTQATILALQALNAASNRPVGEETPRRIEIALNGNPARTIDIPTDQFDVVQQIDLTPLLDGPARLTVSEPTGTGTAFQFSLHYHVPASMNSQQVDSPESGLPPWIDIGIEYDRTRLSVDEHVTAVATIRNQRPLEAPMVMVDLPIPPGFTIERGELDELVGSRLIARYEITPRQAIVYLRELAPEQSLELRYRLRATMPVKAAVQGAAAYLYYDPDQRSETPALQLEVTET